MVVATRTSLLLPLLLSYDELISLQIQVLMAICAIQWQIRRVQMDWQE